MGVKGLLTQLKPLRTFTNAYSRQKGKRLGVDISVWLHQIALHHAAEIVEGEYANFVVGVVGRAKRFAEEGVGLHMVFDGALMPGKSDCKVKRDERRAKSLARNSLSAAFRRWRVATCFSGAYSSSFDSACHLLFAVAAGLTASPILGPVVVHYAIDRYPACSVTAGYTLRCFKPMAVCVIFLMIVRTISVILPWCFDSACHLLLTAAGLTASTILGPLVYAYRSR
jgi:hypothetical protein